MTTRGASRDRRRRARALGAAGCILGAVLAGCGTTSTVPRAPGATLTIGTLYAGSGQFAGSSLPELAGLRFWVRWEDRRGGAYVGSLGRRVRLRLVALDDRSSPALAARLYRRLVQVDHVEILVSDFGSVLTAPAIPVAERAQMLLFDQSGTGSAFFLGDNPYLVLCDLPSSAVWPDPLVAFLEAERLDRVAIVYAGNDFDAAQDTTIATALTSAGKAPVANLEVPTATRHYRRLLAPLRARGAQAVIELGYQDNDLAFLPELARYRRDHPWPALRFVFTAFPGQLHALFQAQVGAQALAGTFTYGLPPTVDHRKVTLGLDLTRFSADFAARSHRPVNFLDVAGYTTGVVIEAALRRAGSLSQLALRAALNAVSGHLETLDGVFRIDGAGAQLGERPSVAELFPTGPAGTTLRVVFPPSEATRRPLLVGSAPSQPGDPQT